MRAHECRSLLHFITLLAFACTLLRLLPLRYRLLLPHGLVLPLERQQLRMRAPLHNPALVEHHNLVGIGNGGQPVPIMISEDLSASRTDTHDGRGLNLRNGDRRAARCDPLQGILDQPLGVGVE